MLVANNIITSKTLDSYMAFWWFRPWCARQDTKCPIGVKNTPKPSPTGHPLSYRAKSSGSRVFAKLFVRLRPLFNMKSGGQMIKVTGCYPAFPLLLRISGR